MLKQSDTQLNEKSSGLSPVNWFFSRISAKLALVMILVVVVPLAGLGITLTIAAQRAVKESVRRDHQEIAKRAAQEVRLFVERPLELLEATGAMIAINRTDAWKQETALVELSVMFPIFEEVLSVDKGGKILASSNPGTQPAFRAREEALSKTLSKETYISGVYLSDDYLPYLDVAIPYFWQGETSGALLARINLRGMWDIIDSIRIGETGRAFLVSKKGILIAHPDKKKVLQHIDITQDPAVEQVLMRKAGTLEESHPGEGKWLVSYAPISTELEWGIVVEQKEDEAYALLRYMGIATALAGFFAVLVAILASVLVSRRVVQPVRALDAWSRRISIGDFDYMASHRAKDELGRLFIAFKRMRDRLREARDQEYLAMLGTASSALAHKIKNSIVSLKTLADLFPSRKNDARFMTQFEETFPNSVEHLEDILKQLSKVASEYSMKHQPVDLDVLVKKLHGKYSEAAKKHKVNFTTRADSAPKIEGDEIRLMDVLENLVVNAIEAMPGGGELELSLEAGRGRIAHPRLISEDNVEYVQITARDTGSGIPKEKLEDVFKPFVTTKQGGMGIGLTVVKKIIQQHGGSIQVESEAGRGTTFTILLPLQASKYGVFK